jgi:hypothetical protein
MDKGEEWFVNILRSARESLMDVTNMVSFMKEVYLSFVKTL